MMAKLVARRKILENTVITKKVHHATANKALHQLLHKVNKGIANSIDPKVKTAKAAKMAIERISQKKVSTEKMINYSCFSN